MAEKASKASVHYRTGSGNRRCGTCSMFREPASCTAVEGKIASDDVCDIWEKKK